MSRCEALVHIVRLEHECIERGLRYLNWINFNYFANNAGCTNCPPSTLTPFASPA